ncbi:response regulator [Paenibacillus sp.]|jgi:CheY-like chemotaxis protein/GAF domain-containing protein|uniref:response regulator n=1 Tax=Paenibacillus sp. TaxID=58172 RepID=UPI002831E413|nr:response regulator [Paenibacillus sp.]MDR0270946.1 response regulator [Paenibacillus sp.]
MRLKTKLVAGFGALMAILVMMTMVGYYRIHDMDNQLDQMYQDRYLKVRYSSGVRAEVNNISRELADLMFNSGDLLEETKLRIEDMVTSGEQSLNKLLASGNSPEEEQMQIRLHRAWEGFKKYEKKQVSLVSQGLWDRAKDYRNTSGLALQTEAFNTVNELVSFQDWQIDSEITKAKEKYKHSIRVTIVIMLVGLLLGLIVILWVIPTINKGLNVVSMMIRSFGQGRFKAIRRIKVVSKDEIGQVALVFKEMAKNLDEKQQMELGYLQAQKDLNWLNANASRITELLRGMNSRQQVSQAFISEFTPVLGAVYGAIYIHDEEKEPNKLILNGTYAGEGELASRARMEVGEGLVGQSALDREPIMTEVPGNYLSVSSALGQTKPGHLMIHPVVFEDELLGVIEVAAFEPFTELQKRLFSQLAANLGIVINNINRRLRVEELLRESQALTEELQCQSEELQTQQEELKRSNENLEEQAEALKNSEDLLQRQQEELKHFNTELIAKTRALEEQMQQLEERNIEIEEAKSKLEQQAMQLAVSSKYKSEFLANMSHELRTPLNSLLILSQLLAENKEANLNSKQTEYARTIYTSGADLLKMIDEILDLAKVDAGKMEINQEQVFVRDWKSFVEQNFMPLANKKQVSLNFIYSDDLPESMITDGHRVKQIIRNLMSNAFKFTSSGSVTFIVKRANALNLPSNLDKNKSYIAIAVKDTGIGIPENKKELIFEAFKQVDGTTSRKYGGTGLGLSISRELASLLGGGIDVESEEGVGSCFTLYLPSTIVAAAETSGREAAVAAELLKPEEMALFDTKNSTDRDEAPAIATVEDDREHINDNDKVLLIIEDDVIFAGILLDMARGRGFKGLVALQGDVGLNMARSYLPDAIILDIQLPVMDGWSILGELKNESATRHIPVHIISVVDEVKQGLKMGAIAYLKKPSSKEALEKAFSHIESYTAGSVKHLLIVEDDEIQRNSIIELIDHDDVMITAVSTGKEALNELRNHRYDSMVLDLMLSDMTGFELLDQIQQDEDLEDLPIIIYTGKDLDSKEEMRLRKYAESIIIKDVKSPERLLDETTLFLHRVEADLPEDKRRILEKLHNKEVLFEGKRILLVDDDIRNVFALSSVLESYDMEVTFAENGREAIDTLHSGKRFDLVLMDMMMPEMDGYEAMRQIRQEPEFHKLPIIALTAKAMKEDRSKCIEAGASDYVKKPIQTEQLLSLMRVWLYS